MEKFYSDKHQIRVPTLLIGIGGIGGRIVKGVYDQLNDYDKSYVEMVVMDTNANDLKQIKGKGIDTIQTSQEKTVADYLNLHKEYQEWFPTNPLINGKNLKDGAGQIRSVSRLGALASESAGDFKTIDVAIRKLKRNRGETITSAVKVMIVGSMTGGTGSGLGIQLPYYIREAISKESNAPDILIRGLFLTPSLTTMVQPTEDNEKAMYVNGYAFIRELNAFYKAQLMDDGDIMVDVEHYQKGWKNEGVPDELKSANQIPYNFMFLLEMSNNFGTNLGDLEAYERQASKIVKNQLFSKFSGNQFSVEDNLIISSITNQGMDRYCGAGYSVAKYPKDDMTRYCTLKFSDNIVKDFWRYFDVKFENECKIQRINMAHDSKLQPLQRSAHYIKCFEAETQDIEAPAEIAMLKRDIEETYIGANDERVIKKTVDVIQKGINTLIEETLEDMDANSGYTSESFTLNASMLKKPDSAQREVTSVYNELESYARDTRKSISENANSVVERILPANLLSAQHSDNMKEYNIFRRLGTMHPLSARYILYVLSKRFDTEIKKAKDEAAAYVDTAIQEDYYGTEKDGKQSPAEAISMFSNRTFLEKALQAVTGDYKVLIRRIIEDFSAEKSRIEEYREAKFTETVYTAVKNRIDMLIKIYEAFFDGLKVILENNQQEILQLENVHEDVIDGEHYVCASGDCKQAVFAEAMENSNGEFMELPEDVSKALLQRIYKEFEQLIVRKGKSDKEKYDFKDVDKVYDECIFPLLEKKFLSFGKRVINLSVFEAIEKEYNIKRNQNQTQLTFEQYMKSEFETVSRLAIPYISYDAKSNVTTSAYWGVNASTVSFLGRYTDGQKLADIFNFGDGCNNDVVDDASFSPYEICCYKAVYGLCVENLLRYRKNTECWREYFNRLNDVLNGVAKIEKNEGAYLSTVHPHLDRRWHNRAYLPMLGENDEADEVFSDVKAFLLGITMGWFEYSEFDYVDCWNYSNRAETVAVCVDGHKVKAPALYNLYEAMEYNSIIKNDIIARAQKIQAQDKAKINTDLANEQKMQDFYYDQIMSHRLIQALCNESLNVVCKVYYSLGFGAFVKSALQFIKNYVGSYCLDMTNNQKELAELLAERIIDVICESKEYKGLPKTAKERFDKILVTSKEAEEE